MVLLLKGERKSRLLVGMDGRGDGRHWDHGEEVTLERQDGRDV